MADRKGIVRFNDEITGVCKHNQHMFLHPGGLDVSGIWDQQYSIKSNCEGRGVVREGDIGTASCGHTFFAVKGSDISRTEGKGMMRIGDQVNIQGGDGVCTTGSDRALST